MTVSEFEQRVLEQRPVGSTHYDDEYFTGEWREGDNNYSLEARRRMMRAA